MPLLSSITEFESHEILFCNVQPIMRLTFLHSTMVFEKNAKLEKKDNVSDLILIFGF